MTPAWVTEILDAINKAVSNKRIGKEELAEGLEDIEGVAGDWARQMREELGE